MSGARRLPRLAAACGAAALALWLAGCAAPAGPDGPEAAPPGPAAPAAPVVPVAPDGPAGAAPAAPVQLVPQHHAEPALRLLPGRSPGERSGPPALRAPQPDEPVLLASGVASWYADSLHGRRTANGERYDREEFTAAHRSLPFGARLCVRSLVNGRTVMVRVNDRGPFTPGRIIDLSRAAAEELGMVGLGVKSVELWRLGSDDDSCPESLAQPAEGSGLGLDAGAAARALQEPAAGQGGRPTAKAAAKRRVARKRR